VNAPTGAGNGEITPRSDGMKAAARETGDQIIFGSYEWQVLEIYAGRMLVITQEIIEYRPYHHKCAEASWESSDLRTYLNGEFYQNFSEADKARIEQVFNSNKLDLTSRRGPLGGVTGFSEEQIEEFIRNSFTPAQKNALQANDTLDRIFILSLSEVKQYFPREAQRWAVYQDKGYSSWWLRAPFMEYDKAPWVSSEGGIGTSFVDEGILDGGGHGVRPALWLTVWMSRSPARCTSGSPARLHRKKVLAIRRGFDATAGAARIPKPKQQQRAPRTSEKSLRMAILRSISSFRNFFE